ncbi:MAG: hypothetical protein ACUVWO_01440 [Thermodesulfobacteriota bacterium]
MEASLQQTNSNQLFREFEEAFQDKNYIRAERIARELGKATDEIQTLREKALKQLILEFRNPQGVVELIKAYRLTREDIDHLLQRIREEAEEKKILDQKQYDIKTMRYLTLAEWIKEYLESTCLKTDSLGSGRKES